MVDSNNEDSKRRATIAFMEGLDELCNQVDKDYKELLSLSLSLEDTLKQVEEYNFEHKRKMNALENDLFIPFKLADRIDICRAWQKWGLSNSGLRLTSISLTLKIIKKSTCNQCKKQLNKDSCYVYSHKNKNIAKWTLENANEFDLEGFYTLFCSENCFKESTHYQLEELSKNNSQQSEPKPTEQSQEQTKQQLIYCQSCFEEIPPKKTYFYNTQKKDGLKFCSKNCYINFYGEDCIKCWNKFLITYLIKEDNNPNHTYCWDCRKEIIKERKELFKKYCEHCKIELTAKNEWNNFICKSCKEKEVDEMLSKSYGENNNLNLENEQNRTEQNRTEQNRTEQNRTEQNRTEQNRTEQNRTEQNRTEQNRTEQNRTEQNAGRFNY